MKLQLTQPVYIDLKPSGLLAAMLSLIAVAASAIVWQLSLEWTLRVVLLALVMGSTVYFVLRDALLRLPQSWKTLSINTRGELEMVNRRGERFHPTLTADTFVHPYLTILQIDRSELQFDLPPLVLMAAQTERQQLRRLHVWLHWWSRQDDLTVAEAASV